MSTLRELYDDVEKGLGPTCYSRPPQVELLRALVELHEPSCESDKVGTPVSRNEALAISRETMRRAESERLEPAPRTEGDWLAECETSLRVRRLQGYTTDMAAWAAQYAPRLIAAAKEANVLRPRVASLDRASDVFNAAWLKALGERDDANAKLAKCEMERDAARATCTEFTDTFDAVAEMFGIDGLNILCFESPRAALVEYVRRVIAERDALREQVATLTKERDEARAQLARVAAIVASAQGK